jgi:hypothetical protein
VTSFDDVSPLTWRALQLLLEIEGFLFEAAVMREREPDQSPDAFRRSLEELLRLTHRLAEHDERVQALQKLSTLQPFEEVQWEFVTESLLNVLDGMQLRPCLSSWSDRNEEAFGA